MFPHAVNIDKGVLAERAKAFGMEKLRKALDFGPAVKAEFAQKNRRDLLAESMKNNRRKHGRYQTNSDFRFEQDKLEKTEIFLSNINTSFQNKILSLEPQSVTYKMTHSEIVNKARHF